MKHKIYRGNVTGLHVISSKSCLVPVRLFPRPSRSIDFGDVSETTGRERSFRLGPRDPKTIDRGEYQGLGTRL